MGRWCNFSHTRAQLWQLDKTNPLLGESCDHSRQDFQPVIGTQENGRLLAHCTLHTFCPFKVKLLNYAATPNAEFSPSDNPSA